MAKVQCPNCNQPYEVGMEHIGVEMECSQCEHVFKVPSFLNVSKIGTAHEQQQPPVVDEHALEEHRVLNSPVIETLGGDEMALVEQENDAEVFGYLEQLKKRHCWEFAVLAVLLNKRFEPIRQQIVDARYEQSKHTGWVKNRSKYNQFIKAYATQFFELLNAICTTMSDDLRPAMHDGSVVKIFDFITKFEQQFTVMLQLHQEFYAEPMPNEEVYIKLHGIITGWAPHSCGGISLLIENLSNNARKMRDSISYEPQISLTPPTLHSFFTIVSGLRLGYVRPQTVVLDIS